MKSLDILIKEIMGGVRRDLVMGQLAILLPLIENNPYIMMGLIVIGTFICYLIIKPVIRWFVLLKQERVLSYIMCSLLILTCTVSFGFIFWENDFVYLVKITLLCMAVFGGVLVIARLIHYFFQLVFTKKV